MKNQSLYCIVDIETTGSYAAAAGITEISICVHNGERLVKHFTTLINPEKRIPVYITALTGISNEMVQDAPVFNEVADTIFDFLNGHIFVAHNVNFDYSFIRHHLHKCGYDLKVKKLCTVRLSRKVFPGLRSYSLGNICRDMKIPINGRHRADGDARATVRLFENILQANGLPVIEEMLNRNSSEHWLPLQLDKSILQTLCTGPGVYYFLDERDKVIYVGKAINVRKRVVSHFTGTDTGARRQNFLRLVKKITCKPCASELHALVLESTEIKKLWPKYNYSQKEPAQKFGLYQYVDRAGYIRLAIDKKRKNFAGICTYNSRTDAQSSITKLVNDYGLHPSLCALDASVCLPDVPAQEYNDKAIKAINSYQNALPSFALFEKTSDKNTLLCLLMQQGCFYGMGYVPARIKKAPLPVLQEHVEPFADNNFIRNSMYGYAEANPEKMVRF